VLDAHRRAVTGDKDRPQGAVYECAVDERHAAVARDTQGIAAILICCLDSNDICADEGCRIAATYRQKAVVLLDGPLAGSLTGPHYSFDVTAAAAQCLKQLGICCCCDCATTAR
jgi:hypothetical protein